MGFDVKILKEMFKRGWERFKTSFPRKALKKAVSRRFATGRVTSESRDESGKLLDELATGVS